MSGSCVESCKSMCIFVLLNSSVFVWLLLCWCGDVCLVDDDGCAMVMTQVQVRSLFLH